MRDAYKILVEEPEGKRPHGRHRCQWEGNIIMDLRGSCEQCNKPSGSLKGGEFLLAG